MTTKELIEKLRPMWAENEAEGFPQPTEPVEMPLTLEGIAERVPAWYAELIEQIMQLRAEIDAVRHELAEWRAKK